MMRKMQAAHAAMMMAAIAACSGGSDSTTEPPPPPPPPASVASVQITPANPSLYVGRTMSLQATLKDANGNTINGRTITWTSSDAGKASVNGNGVLTGVAVGEAVITATSEGKSAQATVSVSIAPVAKVVIDNFDTNIALGAKITLTARTYDDKDQVLTGRSIVWSSDKPQVATIDVQTGELTAVSGGQAHISAVSETRQTSVIVNVRVPVASVQVTTALDTLEAYDVVQLAAVTRDANNNALAGRTITWTSSDPAIATVNPTTGELTGLDRGTVTVTATSEGKQGIAKRVVVIKYRSVSAGTMHACDIASGGIAWCWGLNGAEGRIGDADVGNNKYVSVAVKVPGNHKFTQLNTFARHTCAIDTEAKAWCWGTNSWGSLGTGTNIASSFTPVAVAGGHKFIKVSAGSDHSCGITIANQLYCWGNNDWRQLGTGNNTIANAPVAVNIPEAVKDVATGAGSTCAVGMSSKAYCWGANSIGQVGDGQKIAYGNVFVALPSVVVGGHALSAIDASQQFACALNTVGAAYCWGSNQTKLGNGPQGTDTSTPVAVSGGLNFVSISTGFTHSCAITANADLYCWGSNGNGQLGIAGTHSYVPVKAANNMKAAEVAASGIGTGSGSHTCAISQDRLTVKCWGRNDVGQLGNNETTAAAVKNDPVIVVGQKPLPGN